MNGLFIRLSTQASKILQHIINLFDSIFGYFTFCTILITNLLSGEKMAFTVVFLAVLFDFLLGICTALKQGKFALSRLIQDTFIKGIVYGVPLILVGLVEKMFHEWGLGLYIACSLAIACELWSIFAHLLILAPNMPFIKLLKSQLKGEIESKTGVDIEELTKEKEDETK